MSRCSALQATQSRAGQREGICSHPTGSPPTGSASASCGPFLISAVIPRRRKSPSRIASALPGYPRPPLTGLVPSWSPALPDLGGVISTTTPVSAGPGTGRAQPTAVTSSSGSRASGLPSGRESTCNSSGGVVRVSQSDGRPNWMRAQRNSTPRINLNRSRRESHSDCHKPRVPSFPGTLRGIGRGCCTRNRHA